MKQNDLHTFYFKDKECIEFRLISEEDSIEELTELLHKSYKALADMGLKYVATYQDESITLKRIENAYKCYVGIYKNKIVSTVSLYTPKPSDVSNWYNNDFVAKFGQFAVLPELQKCGIGSRMMDIIENDAQNMQSVNELALDTAESAHHLIDYYKKRGYRDAEKIKWDMTNYHSVVLSKSL
ncbi:GNAT family N-acetyltransferase [Wukongibacter baidiensis]|uniref:GNAT family N-acetyltransferase n=1 Tax=Wukongibacter baidiensis TaxID=1723361 RepID=UPI003D7F2054